MKTKKSILFSIDAAYKFALLRLNTEMENDGENETEWKVTERERKRCKWKNKLNTVQSIHDAREKLSIQRRKKENEEKIINVNGNM